VAHIPLTICLLLPTGPNRPYLRPQWMYNSGSASSAVITGASGFNAVLPFNSGADTVPRVWNQHFSLPTVVDGPSRMTKFTYGPAIARRRVLRVASPDQMAVLNVGPFGVYILWAGHRASDGTGAGADGTGAFGANGAIV
jgi:hypothetical protein